MEQLEDPALPVAEIVRRCPAKQLMALYKVRRVLPARGSHALDARVAWLGGLGPAASSCATALLLLLTLHGPPRRVWPMMLGKRQAYIRTRCCFARSLTSTHPFP